MAQLITVEVGEETVQLDIDLSTVTMREAISLEESLGGETFDLLMKGEAPLRPSLIRAVIYAKLHTLYPDVPLDGFDVDLSALYDALSEEEEEPRPKLVGNG